MITLTLDRDEATLLFTLAEDFMDVLWAVQRYEGLDVPPALTAAGRAFAKLAAAQRELEAS